MAKMLGEILPSSMVIHGDPIKYEVFEEIWENNPLIKKAWHNYEKLVNPDGTLNTMVLASDIQNYKKLMKMADPSITQKIGQKIQEAQNNGIEVVILERQAIKTLKYWNEADLRVTMLADTKNRHLYLTNRHNHKYDIGAYDNRDKAFEIDHSALDALKPEITVFNEYKIDELRRHAKTIANRINQVKIIQ